MIIIIPIGGIGKRFRDNGYSKPKALINVFGKSIISYLLDNLTLTDIEYVYIPYNKEYKKHRFEDYLIKLFPSICFKFYCLPSQTRGAAETISMGIDNLNEKRDLPVLCLDCDNFFTYDLISNWNGRNCVFTFIDNTEPAVYSYLRMDEGNNIQEIKEKCKISNYACTGAYGFNSIHTLRKYISKIIKDDLTQHNEFYVSGIIQNMINDGISFKNKTLDKNNYFCLGTPLQLKLFCKHKKLHINKKRICFDLDNTLVTFPKIKNDYSCVEPIIENIQYLNYLKSLGNTIIIYTARRMKTHSGNIGKINAEIAKMTLETLEKFNISYDELYFGKPYADYYIDDLAVNCFTDLEKELGYYNDFKIKARDFHNVKSSYIETVIKKGQVTGENYYYQHIPEQLKNIFPIYISGDDKHIIIEKIKGTTITDIFLSSMLNQTILIQVLELLNTIHTTEHNDEKVNIYDNYALKLQNRYDSYDYSQYKESESMFNTLLSKLKLYEQKKCGIKGIIHGDPVFTNIIINSSNKLTFLDMRGKVGDQLTIQGDIFYDWAKVYQSLIGYDEILLSKTLDTEYKEGLIQTFKNYFIRKFSKNSFENLKLLTKSLIFTLIPLHNNDKCNKYYDLLSSPYL